MDYSRVLDLAATTVPCAALYMTDMLLEVPKSFQNIIPLFLSICDSTFMFSYSKQYTAKKPVNTSYRIFPFLLLWKDSAL